VTVSVACSRSSVTVSVDPADDNEDGIYAVENYVTEKNSTHDLSSATMLEDHHLSVEP
jgi:hypothetical protein